MRWLVVGVLLALILYLLDKGKSATGQVTTTLLPGSVTSLLGLTPTSTTTDAASGLPVVNVSTLPGIRAGYALQKPVLNTSLGQYQCGQSGYYPVVDSQTGAMVCVPGSSLGIQ